MADRPLSPHLTVYRMHRYTVLTSITNRFTGVVLSAGLIVLVYWLMAAAGGAKAYGRALCVLSSGAFKAIFLILLAAFSYHLFAGIRHLIWDSGRGLERSQSQRSAWLVGIASLLLFAGLACWTYLHWTMAGAGGAR
jgi:succinate dehydrogenase / fumarate reductase cytochrome b subunit